MVKNKIREQIIESYKPKKIENFNVEYQKDLAKTNSNFSLVENHQNTNKNKEFEAWEGSEYAFL
jgi:hypothetical protein